MVIGLPGTSGGFSLAELGRASPPDAHWISWSSLPSSSIDGLEGARSHLVGDSTATSGKYLGGFCFVVESCVISEFNGVEGVKVPVKEPRKLDDAPATSDNNMDARLDVFVIALDFCNSSSRLLSEEGTQELDEDDGGGDAKRAETFFSVNLSARLDDRRGDGVLVYRLKVFIGRTDGSLSWPSAGLEVEEGGMLWVSRVGV